MGSRFVLLSALWCTATLLLSYTRLNECGIPLHLDTKAQPNSSSSSYKTEEEKLEQIAKFALLEKQERGKLSATISFQEEHTPPFFWNMVLWSDLKARIAETNASSLCAETQPGDLTLFPKSDQSTISWPGPRIDHDDDDMSICKFDARPFTYHLPHAMQSIYACWTLWEELRGQPVLVGPPDHDGFGKPFNDRFMVGMMKAMLDVFNVTVTTTEQVDLSRAVDLKIWGYAWDGRAFFMRREDAWKWTESILRSEAIERDACKDVVRVGILNRHPGYGRTILNARDIQDQLSRVFGEKVQVDEVLFEDKTFREQIDWFASHDLIVTSHGAQETGMPFMPKCGVLLEVFPSVYFVPDYFYSLSDSTHVQHYIINNDKSRDPIADTKKSSETLESEDAAKQTTLCPATKNMLDYLLTAIRAWDSCCSDDSR